MEKLWLTYQAAAEYLGVSKDFIRDLVYDGLPVYKVRSKCFVSKKELDRLIAKNLQ